MPQAYIGGIASRSETYMRTHWDHAKKLTDDAGLSAARRTEEQAFARTQEKAGLPLVAPALVAWEDLFRPFVAAWDGVEAGALTRYFETNTFYRQPHVTGEVTSEGDAASAFSLFQIPKGRPWVLTLPSPWDFAVRSRDEHYDDVTALGLAYARLLARVVDAAVARGATVIRFQDPSAVYARTAAPPADTFKRLLETAAGAHRDKATLHLIGGDPFARAEVLNANPLGGLSIEDPGRAAPRDLDIASGTRLTAAVIHGEESLLEDPAQAARSARRLAQITGLPLAGVTNGWDLFHVPYDIQARKIDALARLSRQLGEQGEKEVTA